MATIVEIALEALEQAIPIVRASQYMIVSGCALLLYDYFLTLGQEVQLIWKAPPSTISIIYIANRYIVPLILAVDIYDRLGLASGPNLLLWIWIEGYITVASFMSMHALVAMRVHALHGGGKRMKVLLWVAWMLYAVPTATLLALGLAQRQNTMTALPFLNICYEEISPMLWTVWLPSLAFESLIFVLTVSKAIQEARRNVYSPIASILYRDGILYFLAIAISSIFSMFVWLLGTSEYEGLAKYWATAIVNIAGCRLVLSLKANARALQLVRARTNLGQSSSFLIGHDYVTGCFEPGEYIDLDDIASSQLGTMYPKEIQTHWDAI